MDKLDLEEDLRIARIALKELQDPFVEAYQKRRKGTEEAKKLVTEEEKNKKEIEGKR